MQSLNILSFIASDNKFDIKYFIRIRISATALNPTDIWMFVL